jgi:hypothetical protein
VSLVIARSMMNCVSEFMSELILTNPKDKSEGCIRMQSTQLITLPHIFGGVLLGAMVRTSFMS